MPTLLMLKGLPASGKTTRARDLVDQGWWRINKDEIRAMVHNSKHSKFKEKFVMHWRDEMIKDTLGGGNNVVVDDTNFNPIHKATFQAICQVMGYTFAEEFIDTPLQECIKRDANRPHPVGAGVIRDMYNKYLKPAPVVYTPPEGRPPAIICDIDGTLAHMNGRSPFEWDKVGEDTYDRVIGDLLRRYVDLYEIILVSGRDAVCRNQTVEWLKQHDVHYRDLLMRGTGDMRKDTIVKRELFDEYVRDNYDVRFVLDDRDQVVRMWRDNLGLKVLQVADGDF